MNTQQLDPYIRFGAAVIMANNKRLNGFYDIDNKIILNEISNALSQWRLKPKLSFSGKETVEYTYTNSEKGDATKGIFLAPHVITEDIKANNTFKAAKALMENLKKSVDNNENITMSIIPIAGEYLSFGISGKIGRGKPKLSLKEASLGMLTTLTSNKPALQHDRKNTTFLPDIEFDKLIDFIKITNRLRIQQTSSDLMIGKVHKEEKGNKSSKKVEYKPVRPRIYNGNFPNAPHSTILGNVALLGAIGELNKEAEVSKLTESVLESLKGATIYQISYGNATTFRYNHHVIDLAKSGNLKSIIDSIYYTALFQHPSRNSKARFDYEKFDMFASRFLILFNRPTFKDFLSFRAQYPYQMEILLETYFEKVENMEKINDEIVKSAKSLGKWINQVAYFHAKNSVKQSSDWDTISQVKAKALIEIESSAFSAKTGNALIAQVVTRAGRLSNMDAPAEAGLFMEKTASGDLPLENAKNLIIAFSRLTQKSEKQSLKNDNQEESEPEKSGEDKSNI